MRPLIRSLGLALAAGVLAAVSACGGGPGATGDRMNVVVAFYPLQYAAERVGGDSVHVTNLVQPGGEAHDLELTPRQIASLSEADLVIYQKGFQPAVDEAIAQSPSTKALDVSTVVTYRATAPAPGSPTGAGSQDPHVWLNPDNMVAIAKATSASLAKARPQGQSSFESNTAALEKDLTRLDSAYATSLATCKRREFVVSHAAFGYLAERYQLTQIPIRGLTPDDEPSPARVAEVQQLAKQHGVTTIFYETLVSPAVAEAVAGDLGLRTDVLDPLEGLTPQSKGTNYVEIMGSNLTALKAANECT